MPNEAARRVPTHESWSSDYEVDEPDEIVTHVVQGVTARRPCRTTLTPQFDGVGLKVLCQ